MSDQEEERIKEEFDKLGLPKECKICDRTRDEHAQLEQVGELHHRFSENGELTQIAVTRRERQPIISASDLALRSALVRAGVIEYDDIAAAEVRLREVAAAQRRGSSGDNSDRVSTEPERGSGSTPAGYSSS